MRIINQIISFIIGGLFIFSGIIKINDPVGTAIKLEEYFDVFAADIASFFHIFIPISLPLAVFLVVFEVALGVSLLAGFKKKLTIWALLALIIFFTFLTFYSAYFNKVTDCGCFGDAIPLDPWQSFSKDIILLVLILILFFQRNRFSNAHNTISLSMVSMSTLAGIFFAITAIRHLPFKDFRNYRIGANIPLLMESQVSCDYLYLMEKDGEIHEFKEYPSDASFTFKEMVALNEKECSPKITDYNVMDEEGNDQTSLSLSDKKLFIVVHNVAHTHEEPFSEIIDLVDNLASKDIEVMLLTSDANAIEDFRHHVQLPVQPYFVDATVLKAMVRSNPGLLYLEDGVVQGKWH